MVTKIIMSKMDIFWTTFKKVAIQKFTFLKYKILYTKPKPYKFHNIIVFKNV